MTSSEDPTLPSGPDGGGPARGADDDPTRLSDTLVGQTVDGFVVKSLIGGGGMGEVYLAEQDLGAGKKLVALKSIRTELVSDRVTVQRFQEEALAAGTLKSNFVAGVMSYGKIAATASHPAMHYLVMEYASDGTLRDYMKTFPEQRLPFDEGIRLLRQAAEGMLAAERRTDATGAPDPIVHRDIKPANLLLQRSGATDEVEIRISDFGAVKRQQRLEPHSDVMLSQGGAPMTPVYASPEQWNWEELDHRSDMYSLGATFYHALTGGPAAKSRVYGEIRKFTVESRCLSLSGALDGVPAELNAVIEKMTARDVGDRYASFADVIEALEVFEQQPASSKKLVWGVLLAAAAVVVAVVLSQEPGGYSGVKLREEYEQLKASLSLDVFESTRIKRLPVIKRRRAEIEDGIDDAFEAIPAGADSAVSASAVETKANLERDAKLWRRSFEEATESLRPLDTLRKSYKELSTKDALDRLSKVVPKSQGVRKEQDVLRMEIEARQKKAQERVRDLEQRFSRSRDVAALSELCEEIGSEREQTEQVDVALGEALASLLEDAKDARAALDTWTGCVTTMAEAAEGQAKLADFVKVAAQLQELEGKFAGRPRLGEWWPEVRGASTASWKGQLEQCLQSLASGYADRLAETRRGDDAARRKSAQELRPSYEELLELFDSVNKAAGGMPWLNLAIEARLEAPRFDYSVAELADDYRRVQAVATAWRESEKAVTGQTPGDSANLVGLCDRGIRACEQKRNAGEVRVLSLGALDLPANLSKRLQDKVATGIRVCKQLFRSASGELDLVEARDALRTLQKSLAPWDPSSFEDAKAVYASIDQAVEDGGRLQTVIEPSRSGKPDFPDLVDRSMRALQVLGEIRSAQTEDSDLRAWRTKWVVNQTRLQVAPVLQRLSELAKDKDALSKAGGLVAFLEKLDNGQAVELRRRLEEMKSLLTSGPSKPDGWSTAAWELWPKDYSAPDGLKTRAEGGKLIGWFECRSKSASAPVEMVLIRPAGQAPFLVDRHEVCVGELLAYGLSETKDPGGWRKQNFDTVWKTIRDGADTLLSKTSIAMAKDFASKAYADVGLVLTLPTAAQWQALVQGVKGGEWPERRSPADVKINTDDESEQGVYGLVSGLAEWLQDQDDPVGVDSSQFKRGRRDAANWRKGVGLRCILNLKKWK